MARKNKRRRDQHPKRGRRTLPVGEFNRAGFDTNYSHEESFDGGWHVRQVPAWRAVKIYTCPGCLRPIPQGQTHVVTWRSDWLMGDEDAGQLRRHWHTACWNNRRQDLRY
ncbi:hypothetical protein [Enteractinococcus helveticum]|uniref:hypothetical protein n=1 Tax=Enteractinococcus helveticum TaxID=1837282 RepID=UPI0009EDE3FD|nr:hypothetical protein [Enteractinococcus helveticum]